MITPGIDHVLGKTSDYVFSYNPGVLAREPRAGNRTIYGIDENTLPFVGADIWHAYECSFLLNNGLPITGILKMCVSAKTQYLVESKSLKMYLFSFNMEKLGATRADAVQLFCATVSRDISAVVDVLAKVSFFDTYTVSVSDDLLSNALPLSAFVRDLETMSFKEFTENHELLDNGDLTDFFISSDLLRSNCKITHQPDWGTVFIRMKSGMGISAESLARYLVSFRGENHFHEEIVECIYKRLWDRFTPESLMVCALYTRRGGIDICPVRASSADQLPAALLNTTLLTTKEYRR